MPAGWVEAGAAVVGAGESIAAGNAAGKAAKANNANAAQLSGAQNTMLNKAEQVANQPFQAYTGTLTAPMSGNEQLGYSLAAKTANDQTAQGDVQKATGLIDQEAGNSWNSDTAAKYMNPYTQAVTDASIAASNKQYLQNLAGLQTRSAGSGAFGGSREAIAEGQLASNQNLNIGNLTATGNANAYDSAVKTWQADNQRMNSAAAAYQSAGEDITKMTSDQISDLMKTGGVAQVIAQTDLNNQYGQFMRQQGWSAQQLGPLINAVQVGKGGVSQQAPPQSNTANQILGLGSTIAGLFGGGSSSMGWQPTVNNSAPSTGFADSINVPSYSPDVSNLNIPSASTSTT